MSSHALHGNLQGVLCGDCTEPLSSLKVRIYRVAASHEATRLAVADPKDTFRILSEEQVRAKEARLLAEIETDAQGSFVATFDERSKYQGEPVEIDVFCATVPRRRAVPPPPKPIQVSITTVQPQWRQRRDGAVATWHHAISQRFWCHLRSLFDAWVICGKVTVCGTKRPAVGVKVSAFDRDWLVDDPLGFAVTDGNGHFRIDYLGADFRHGSWIDVELVGGPDVYFRLESPSGEIVQEPAATGRQPGRENLGPCACFELCVKEEPVVSHAWFTRVGELSIESDISTTTGLTLSAQPAGFPSAQGGPGYGFWGALKLVGDCPTRHPATSSGMRYRFGTRPAGSPAAVTWITGAAVDAIKVGSRPVTWDFGSGPGIHPQDIVVAGAGGVSGTASIPHPSPSPVPPPGTSWGAMPALVLQPDADGWVTLPSDATNGGFSGPLLRVHSSSFSPGGAAPDSGAGNDVADKKSGSDFEIVFEAAPLPGLPGAVLTNKLPRLHVANWLEVAVASVDQLSSPGTTPCSALTTALDLRYTMDHELVRSWDFSLITSATIPGGPPVLPSGTSSRGAHGTRSIDTSAWPDCAYAINFSRSLKLTDGERADAGRSHLVALFCKRT